MPGPNVSLRVTYANIGQVVLALYSDSKARGKHRINGAQCEGRDSRLYSEDWERSRLSFQVDDVFKSPMAVVAIAEIQNCIWVCFN